MFFAFFQADRIDDALALHAAEACLDDRPFRRVDHDRHAGDVGFRSDEVQERHHRLLRIEHALVHVDVDDLRTVLDLLPGDLHGVRVIVGFDQLAEYRRAGDVGALADIDEQVVWSDRDRLEPRQPAAYGNRRDLPRRLVVDDAAQFPDVIGGCAAASAHEIHEATLHEFADDFGHVLRRLVIVTELVRQPGVRMCPHVCVRDTG